MKTELPEQCKKIAPLLLQFKSEMEKLYSTKLNAIILYGSYARGTATENSDVDILLVLNQMNSPYKEIGFTSDITAQYLLQYGLNISIVPTQEHHFNESELSFYNNIHKEGIIL